MGIHEFCLKVMYRLEIKKRPVLTKEDQWRARGVTIGKNFDGPDSTIDYCFGHLVTIGDNVTISGHRFWHMMAVRRSFLATAKLVRSPLETMCLLDTAALFCRM